MEKRIQKEKLEQAEKEKEREYNLRMKELEMQDKVKKTVGLRYTF